MCSVCIIVINIILYIDGWFLCLYPLCLKGEEEVEQVPAETLYQGLLPSLPQYMVSALCPRPLFMAISRNL